MTAPPYYRLLLAGAGLLAFVALAGIGSDYLLPRQFLAKTTIEVRNDHSLPGGVTAPSFQAHRAMLSKSEVLEPVIKELNLTQTFSKNGQPLAFHQVARKLAGSLEVREIRNTGLIEVGVYHRDPQMAAKIANAVVLSYGRTLEAGEVRLGHLAIGTRAEPIRIWERAEPPPYRVRSRFGKVWLTISDWLAGRLAGK